MAIGLYAARLDRALCSLEPCRRRWALTHADALAPVSRPRCDPARRIPFYIGANNAINFWAGSLVTHFWNWAGPRSAEELSMVVGAGLLVGGGVFAIPSAVLALAGVAPPLCMSFSTSAPAGGA